MQQQQQSVSLQDKLLMSVKQIFRIYGSGHLCTLKGDITVSPSYALYEARYMDHPSCDPDIGEEYKRLSNIQKSLCKELRKCLPDDKHEILNDLIDVSMNMVSLNKSYIYRQGLQDGFLLMVEMLPVEEKNNAVKKPSPVADIKKAL